MRYDYCCESCGSSFEVIRSMSERKDQEPCACGGVATQIITVPDVIIRGNQRPVELRWTDRPPGWSKKGGIQDPETYERHLSTAMQARRKMAQDNKKEGIKRGVQYVGTIPLAVARIRERQYGRDYYNQPDILQKMKEDDCLFTE